MKKIYFILILSGCFSAINAQVVDVETLPKAKKFTWNGTVGGSATGYHTTASENRSNPFSWNLNGSFSGHILETFDLPFSFSINQYQSVFTKPEFQFGISPRYKWATLHLGNRNMTFNPYTLNGITFLGAGLELTPKKWRFAAMYGRLRRAEEIDTSIGSVKVPAFKRIGYGAKIGYGSPDTYIELMYFHAKDDSNSIKNWKDPRIQQYLGDANIIKPQENNVVGLSSKLTLGKFSANFESGVSFFNPDMSSMQFVNPKKGFDVSHDTVVQYAGKAGIGYNFTNFTLRADYERILPGYISLGNTFFNTDIANFTISPSGSFDSSKGNYALSFGIQENNLDNSKKETTKRFISSGNVSWAPSLKWNFSLAYNNFSINQVAGTEPVNDSTRIRQINQTFTLTPTYTITKDSTATHSFSLTGNYNDVNDRNIVTRVYGNMKASMVSFNHSSSFTRRGNSISSGLNFNHTKTASVANTQFGATAGYSQAFFKGTLNTSISTNYNISYVNGTQDGNIITGNATASYQVKKRHNFSFTASLIRTNSKQFESYTELMGTIAYQFTIR